MKLSVTHCITIGISFLGSVSTFTVEVRAPHGGNSNKASLSSLSTDSSATSSDLYFFEADSEALFAESTFPIKPDDLIVKAKEALKIGVGLKDGGECVADDFKFRAAVIGPHYKEEYLYNLENFKFEEAFKMTQNIFGFTVDPLQPNRVWCIRRLQATHVGDFLGIKPTGKVIDYPPESFHIDFNEEGKVTEFGFYTIDRAQGNTGGLGGAFGFLYALGKAPPCPEAKPFKPSLNLRLLNFLGGLVRKFNTKKD